MPFFSRLALAATSAAVNCASISSSDMPSSWQRCRYSAVTISAETSGMEESLEQLMADVAALNGVVRVEVLAG